MNNRIPPSQVKQTIIYLTLLSYIPPKSVSELLSLQSSFGDDWPRAVEAASRLIVAFHQASRDPDSKLVEGLVTAALDADSSPEACRAFQEKVNELAKLPGRAKANNRLHRKKGCRFCEAPCRYGYFSLISEPDFNDLQSALEAENNKPPLERQPVQAIWMYTLKHLSQTLNAGQWQIPAAHLGNLAYCLLMLSTAKSRFAFPEEVVKRFQEQNQQLIQRYHS